MQLGVKTKILCAVNRCLTGIEYVINEEMDTCHNVSQIPKHAGDVQVSTGKSLLYSMKNATDILFNRNSVNWTYSEKLYGDILTDVWTYEVQEDFENYTTTYEVFFTTNDWEVNGPFGDHKTKSAVPLAMKIYRHSTLEPILTVQHFHDFVPYVEHNLPSDAFCVEACADGGYSLVVQLNSKAKKLLALKHKSLYSSLF